jgi:hypothetical protein
MTVLIEGNGPNAVVTSRALRDVPGIKGRISSDMRGELLEGHYALSINRQTLSSRRTRVDVIVLQRVQVGGPDPHKGSLHVGHAGLDDM